MRLSTAHLILASVRWVARPRAQSRPPKSALNLNIVFSAILCRVHPLRTRHVDRPYASICWRIVLRVARHAVGVMVQCSLAVRRGTKVGVAPRFSTAS